MGGAISLSNAAVVFVWESKSSAVLVVGGERQYDRRCKETEVRQKVPIA
jgi:hypothetical protein